VTGGRCHPARPWGPIPGSLALVLGWWLVAHSSGQGWVQALGDAVTAAVLLGLLGPWLALRRARVEIAHAPLDGTAGRPVEIALRRSAGIRLTPVDPPGPARTEGALEVVAARRGVVTSVTVEMATAAPFGVQWWTRRVVLALPHPLHIAPRRGRPGAVPAPAEDTAARDVPDPRPGPFGDLRAPRPYRAGDARKSVHWPATAHTGELMVRETERPRGQPPELVVDLPADPAAAEAEAERALATALALVDRHGAVLLTTTEAAGTRRGVVADARQAGRRLAAAK